jgi:hypothetical protein
MPVAPREITLAMLAEARRLYTRTQVPVEDICTMLGIGTYTFYQRRKQWGWPMRSRRIPRETPPVHPDDEADAHELDGAEEGNPPAPQVRTANLIALLHDATEREFAKLDRIASKIGDERGDLPDMQNALRTRASAGRMLRELITIEKMTETDSGADNDGFPRTESELRRAILGKMDAILARRGTRVPGEPDDGGAGV